MQDHLEGVLSVLVRLLAREEPLLKGCGLSLQLIA
jgi:hypothetical protein